MGKLSCVVVTPEKTALEQQADFVVLPLFDGEIGIAPGHSPLIGRLAFGEIRLKEGGESVRYYLDGGFVQVTQDLVSVLTNRAVPAAELNVEVAEQLLESARQRTANSPELLVIRDRAVDQARAQLRMARRGT